MKRVLWQRVAIAAVLAWQAAAAQADQKLVRIGVAGDYAPWNLTEPSGKLAGFDIDVATDICRRLAVRCEFVAQDFAGLIPSLKAGKFDAIFSAMSITDARRQVVSFSEPYAGGPVRFGVLKQNSLAGLKTEVDRIDFDAKGAAEDRAVETIKTWFKGKAMGVGTGSSHERFARAYLADSVTVRPYGNQEELLMDLVAGRVDFIAAGMSYLVPTSKSDHGKDLAIVGPTMIGGPFGIGVGAAFRPENQDLRNRFNDAIRAAKADGTIRRLGLQWFGYDVSVK